MFILTEAIYVRVFEERMDLIQAGIVGAPGTPYHDCLFFFDIFLPPDYPHEPPVLVLSFTTNIKKTTSIIKEKWTPKSNDLL